jgi:WD40 repeat protein
MMTVRRHFTVLIITITLYFILSCSALSSLNFGVSYKVISPENANRLAPISKLPYYIDCNGYSIDTKRTTMFCGSTILIYQTLQSGSKPIKIVENSPVSVMAFSPDGKRLVMVEYDNTELWNAENGTKIAELPTKRGYAAFSPDGKVIATTSPWAFEETEEGTTVQLWNASDGKAIKSLTVSHRTGGQVAFSDDGKTLAIGTVGGAYLWDMKSDQPSASFAETDFVLQIGFSPNNRQLMALSPRVRVWDIAEEKELTFFQYAHEGKVNGAIFSPDNSLLVTWGEDRKAKVWGFAERTERSFDGLSELEVGVIGFDPDGKRLSILNGNTIAEWDTTTGKRLVIADLESSCGKVEAVSPDWQLVICSKQVDASSKWDVELPIWSFEDGKIISTLHGNGKENLGVEHIQFSPDGKFLAAVFEDDVMDQSVYIYGVR